MANYITITRMLLIFPVLILVTPEASPFNWIALAIFIFAGITDHLDGFVARRYGTESSLGALLDLMADKLLIIVILFFFISFESNILLIIPSLIILVRELVITSFRQLLTEKQGVNPIKVTFIAKSKTTIQILALSFLIIAPNFGQSFLLITICLFWLAAYVSVHSIYEYLKIYGNLIK